MRKNINLITLLGVPERVSCPSCKELVPSGFDDFDPNMVVLWEAMGNLYLKLDCCCHDCMYEFDFFVEIGMCKKKV